MLWVLKRTAPKHMFNLMRKEINAILGAQIILIWTYVIVLFCCYICGKYIQYLYVCLFVLILYIPVNKYWAMSRRVFLDRTSTKQRVHNVKPVQKISGCIFCAFYTAVSIYNIQVTLKYLMHLLHWKHNCASDSRLSWSWAWWLQVLC